MLRNFKNDKTFLSAKYQFSAIQFVKVISNKPFFLLKALNPGLKLTAWVPNGAKRLHGKFTFTREDLSEIYLLPLNVCMVKYPRDFQYKVLNYTTCTNILLKAGDFKCHSRSIWSPAKIAGDFRHLLMRTHLVFFCRSRRCGSFKNSCDKIAQPDRLT